jgi:hypothetical protein
MKQLLTIVLLLLASCTPDRQPRYKVGQSIELLTGERLTIIAAHAGPYGAEPSYTVSDGVGWKIKITPGGVQGTRGRYNVLESQVKP